MSISVSHLAMFDMRFVTFAGAGELLGPGVRCKSVAELCSTRETLADLRGGSRPCRQGNLLARCTPLHARYNCQLMSHL